MAWNSEDQWIKGVLTSLKKGLSHNVFERTNYDEFEKLKPQEKDVKTPLIISLIGDHVINDVAKSAKRGKPHECG